MLAMGFFAVLAAYFKIAYIDRYRREDKLVQELAQLGVISYAVKREPTWLWSWFGDHVSRKVTSITINGPQIGDAELTEICTLTDMCGLRCENSCTGVTDKGIESVSTMSDLVELGLRKTSITKLPPLHRLTKLVDLDLAFTNLELANLPSLPALTNLNLRDTRLSDQTLALLPPLPNLISLDIAAISPDHTKITGNGLRNLTREICLNMAIKAKQLAKPEATQTVAKICMEAAR